MTYNAIIILFAAVLVGCNAQRESISIKSIEISSKSVVYGEDGRLEARESKDHSDLSQSVAVMVHRSSLELKGEEYKFVDVMSLEEEQGLCGDEKFGKQMSLGSCSGFLVAENLLVTAGHCFEDADDCAENVWVFDYSEKDSKKEKVNVTQVYGCKKIIARRLDENTQNDYTIIELDRKSDRKPLKYRKKDAIQKGEEVFMVGYPSGIPVKVAIGATTRSTKEEEPFFMTNLDSFGGNSGSPVLNKESGEVEGILVRGEEDYIETDEGCMIVNVCSDDGCVGEAVTKISEVPIDKISSPKYIASQNFITKVESKKYKEVQELIKSGQDVNVQQSYTMKTPLMIAIFNNDKEMITILLDHKLDLELMDKDSNSIVNYVLENIEEKFYQDFLMDSLRKAPNLINRRFNNGDTLIMSLAQTNDHEILGRILSTFTTVDLNRVSPKKKWTALMYAGFYSSDEAALVLLEFSETDINKISKYNRTAFEFAVRYNGHKVVEKFLSREDLAYRDYSKIHSTPLMISLINKDTKVYETLANSCSININETDSVGQTVLHYAVRRQLVSIVADLLSRGANKNILDKEGKKPIDIARENQYSRIVELLIEP